MTVLLLQLSVSQTWPASIVFLMKQSPLWEVLQIPESFSKPLDILLFPPLALNPLFAFLDLGTVYVLVLLGPTSRK